MFEDARGDLTNVSNDIAALECKSTILSLKHSLLTSITDDVEQLLTVKLLKESKHNLSNNAV